MADDLKHLFRAGKTQRGLDVKPIKEKYKKPSSDLKPSGNQQPQQSHLPADFFAPDNQKNATATKDNNIDQDYAELMRAAHQQEEPAPQPSPGIPKDTDDDTQQQQTGTVPGEHNEEEAAAQDEEERREFEQFVRQQRLEEIKRAAVEKRRIELDPLILDIDDDASIPSSSLSLIGGGKTDGSRAKKKTKLAHTIAALENIGSASDTDNSEEEEEEEMEELLDWRAKRVKEGRK